LHKQRADGYKQTIKQLQMTLDQEHEKYQTLQTAVLSEAYRKPSLSPKGSQNYCTIRSSDLSQKGLKNNGDVTFEPPTEVKLSPGAFCGLTMSSRNQTIDRFSGMSKDPEEK
jgi:hypothetical protein